jgi:hypothetical protein
MIFNMAVEKVNAENPQRIQVHESHALTYEFLTGFNLVMVSYSGWKDLTRARSAWLANTPSTLILKPQRS